MSMFNNLFNWQNSINLTTGSHEPEQAASSAPQRAGSGFDVNSRNVIKRNTQNT